jgi:hypothetical protein
MRDFAEYTLLNIIFHNSYLAYYVGKTLTGDAMWVLKGTALGLAAFLCFTMVRLKVFLYPARPPEERGHVAVAVSALLGLTIRDPWWWIALGLMVVTGMLCAKMTVVRFQ